MRHLIGKLRRFGDDNRGTVAMTFALVSIVAFGMVGGAVDLGRALKAYSTMQASADAVALSAVSQGYDMSATQETALLADARARLEGQRLDGVAADLNRVNDMDAVVTITAEVPLSVMSAVPGMNNIPIRVMSRARGFTRELVAGPPSKVDLSYEAADYNQVWAYCYDRNWQANGTRASDEGTKDQAQFDALFEPRPGSGPETAELNDRINDAREHKRDLEFVVGFAETENREGRSDFHLIAHNGPGAFNIQMPTCKGHETVSYMLYNARWKRTSPSQWEQAFEDCSKQVNPPPGASSACFKWYTDTRLVDGVEVHQGTSPFQLETVLCEDQHCEVVSNPSRFIPANNQVNRIPQVVDEVCAVGKYMYFGWEDRPPQNTGGNGRGNPYPPGQSDPGGDRDYDDIRLIVACPEYVKGDIQVRLVE